LASSQESRTRDEIGEEDAMSTHKQKRRTSRVGNPLHAVFPQREWLRVALASISDAFITTDTQGRVNFLNPEAQSLTGWTQEHAEGLPLERVFNIINEATRQAVENPAGCALREGQVVGLTNHTLLIAKDGTERPIDHSATPMRTTKGEVTGVVLVFRDSTHRSRRERMVLDALTYAENIIATLREPFIVLDDNLRVRTANRAFYQTFHALPERRRTNTSTTWAIISGIPPRYASCSKR
jgi:PAS domain S-box-containing protein